MPYYRAASGEILYFSSISFANQLPAGSVVIPDAEALAALPTALSTAQETQIAILDQACADTILGGFVSDALGAAYTYPSGSTDQTNLTGAVVRSLIPNLPAGWTINFWCEDTNGVWALRPHNAAQIQEVGSNGLDMVAACIAHKVVLETQVMNAEDDADVTAIVWVAPSIVMNPAAS